MQYISSTQNPLVKKILLLQEKSRIRKKEKLFIVEGKREIELAIKGNYKLNTILIYKDLTSKEEINTLSEFKTNTTAFLA